MATKDLLGSIFQTPEHEVRTFMDVIRPGIAESASLKDALGNKEIAVKSAAVTKVQTAGLIRIETVEVGEDIAWHISPTHPKRPWKRGEDRVIYTIIKVMASVIPKTVRVEISAPYRDPQGQWSIKEMTFKAKNIKKEWSVRSQDIDRMIDRLFAALNELV